MTTRGIRDERGASAAEYGLIVAAFLASVLIGVQAVGATLSDNYKAHHNCETYKHYDANGDPIGTEKVPTIC